MDDEDYQFHTDYIVGTMIRIQLDPEGTIARYTFNKTTSDWIDNGSGGWVDAQIISTTFFDQAKVYKPSHVHIGCLEFLNIHNETKRWHFALEKSRFYPFPMLKGYPIPAQTKKLAPLPPKCCCGSDATYGPTNKVHMHYCEKYVTL